jgi:hypothetical protein
LPMALLVWANAAGATANTAAAPRHKSLKVMFCTSLPGLVWRAFARGPVPVLDKTPRKPLWLPN